MINFKIYLAKAIKILISVALEFLTSPTYENQIYFVIWFLENILKSIEEEEKQWHLMQWKDSGGSKLY